MNEKTRILMLEDNAADAELINNALRDGGLDFSSKRVDTETEFMQELQRNGPDVILSDHGLPTFDGFAALAAAREHCPDVPFIFVTGGLEEEIIASFKMGATDYVLKNRLAQLVPVIQRALRAADDRRARKWLEVERNQLISELKATLTQIKSLSGLLSLCTFCKRVRDHEHGWQPLEVFLQKHSDATLTHEICPDCINKIPPAALGRTLPSAHTIRRHTIGLRTETEIQEAHDLLLSLLLDVLPHDHPTSPIHGAAKTVITAQAAVLCWVLRHDNSPMFAEALAELEEALTAKGYEKLKMPNGPAIPQ